MGTAASCFQEEEEEEEEEEDELFDERKTSEHQAKAGILFSLVFLSRTSILRSSQ